MLFPVFVITTLTMVKLVLNLIFNLDNYGATRPRDLLGDIDVGQLAKLGTGRSCRNVCSLSKHRRFNCAKRVQTRTGNRSVL